MRAILMPVKSFARAKLRLSARLNDELRRYVAEALAATVLQAASSCPVFVACDDGEVADWAIGNGGQVLWTPGLGLSGAINASVERLADNGFSLATVVHADLPFVHGLANFGRDGTVTLAPDRHHDGTNVASVPTRSGFQFSYGAGSFSRHRAESSRLGLPCEIHDDWRLATDVDVPADLTFLEQLRANPVTEVQDRDRLEWLKQVTMANSPNIADSGSKQ